jgi:LAS superfamily LD-carboxypeptidase LdcB
MSARRRKINYKNLTILIACMVLIASLLIIVIGSAASHVRSAASEAAAASPSSTPEETEGTTVDQSQFTDTNSLLLIANKKHKLPDGYVPSDLTAITGIPKQNRDEYMRAEAAQALVTMFNAASAQGVSLYLVSGYRSQEYQEQLYNSYVAKYGQEGADAISSRPGYSDHQTGLACDLGQTDLQGLVSEDFINTTAGQWLYQHAHEYGFVLRYPQGKEEITGYSYEPWHYRYVGVETACAIYAVSPDETLEEYFNIEGGDYA